MKWYERISPGKWLLVGAMVVAVQGLILYAMGQPLICGCGNVRLWGGIVGPEISQQLTDWYTYSHLTHGIGFYLLLWLVAPQIPIAARFAAALGLEGAWEILENTPWVINRYRQTAIAQGYFGDSVVNSVSDSLAAALGFGLARLLPARSTIVLVIATELFVGYMIRDNLTLNIIQLVHPIEAISRWQVGR